MKKYEGIMKICLSGGVGESYVDADPDRIPEMATRTKREGKSPAKKVDEMRL